MIEHLSVPNRRRRSRSRGTPPTTRCWPRASGSSSTTRTGSTASQAIGVDEHVWRHTRRGDKYVTVIIDLTPVRDGTGPARLLDMVPGRSKQAFQHVAGRACPGVARRRGGRRDGRVHRVQDRHHRGTARRHRGDGPPSTWSGWPATRWTAAAAGSNRRSTATEAAPTTRSTGWGVYLSPDSGPNGRMTPGKKGHCGRYRKFSPEYRVEAVKMVIETSRPIAAVARDLGIN